jgi:hypothetical protein
VEEDDEKSPLPQNAGELAAGLASGVAGYKLLSNPIVQRAMPIAGAVYSGYDAVNRANSGDKMGSAIAAAGAVPALSYPSIAVQAARDKYKTGEFFPSDEKIRDTYARSVMEPPPAPANQRPTANTKQPWEHKPVKTYAMEDGSCLECWGDEQNGFEIRHQGRSLPTRFPKIDHADIAVKLFQNRHQDNQNQDYIEEK